MTDLLYLSDEWLAAADRAVAGLPSLPVELVVGYVVTGGPDGDRSHQVVLGPDRVGFRRSGGTAAVTLTMAWPVAVAVHRGELSAQQAVLDGRIRLGGDAGVLLGHQATLGEVDDRLDEVRAATRYERSA